MQEGLISSNNVAGLTNQFVNPDVRASQLLQFIRNSVLVDCSNFQAFVNVLLKRVVHYKGILKILDDKYKELGMFIAIYSSCMCTYSLYSRLSRVKIKRKKNRGRAWYALVTCRTWFGRGLKIQVDFAHACALVHAE